MRFFVAFLAIFGSLVALALWTDRNVSHIPTKEELTTQNAIMEAASEREVLFVVHKPDAGCPDGWREIAKAFSEEDGTYQDACLHGTGAQGGIIDFIRPGERFPGVATIWALGSRNSNSVL